jgi:hypothetical protein
MGIKSISVNGTSYKIDYDALENTPDLTKDSEPTEGSEHYITSGAVAAALKVTSGHESAIEDIQQRLSTLESAIEAMLNAVESDTSTTVSGDKLSLTGSGSNINGEKLSVTGSEFTVNGEKMSIL